MNIIIADDHIFTLHGTKSFVEKLGYQVIETCQNGIVAQNLINIHHPEIAILDISMPGLDGLDLCRYIQEKKIRTKAILLTMHKELSIFKKAQEYNAYGYILKEHAQSELEKCLKAVKNGEKYISPEVTKELRLDFDQNSPTIQELNLTEKKIIEFIKLGKTTKQIAEMLFLSEKTVENYRTKIIEKLQIPKEKNALLIWALKN